MTLLPLGKVVPDLRCPACLSQIRFAAAWYCTNETCRMHGEAFRDVAGAPVLIDFERSIVDPEAFQNGNAPVWRSNGVASAWYRRMFVGLGGENRAAHTNAERVRAFLRERTRRRLLIVGGASIGDGAECLYRDPEIDVIAFDIAVSPATQFVADAHTIPLADGSVDAVWIQAVLEHVLDPAKVVAEIERVLVDGGLVYADTPFMQEVHLGPYDFTRFTESGHRWLFRRFECIDSGVASGPGQHLAWALDYAVRSITRSRKAGRLVHLLALPFARLVDAIGSPRHAVDGACAVYFLGKKSNTELRPLDMVKYYSGSQMLAHGE